MKRMAVIVAGLMITASTAWGQTAAPSDAYLYIITPRDGARVRNPVIVRFGLRNMGVTRAGDTAANVGQPSPPAPYDPNK